MHDISFRGVGLIRPGVFAGLLLAGAGCGGPKAPAPVTHWLGPSPHIRAVGFINSEAIDISLTGAAAADTAQLFCEREYAVPSLPNGQLDYAQGHNSEVRVRMPVSINGQMRNLYMEFKKHDFQDDAVGAQVSVVPRDDLNPPLPPAMWFAWAWHNFSDDTVVYKQAAATGTFTSGEFTGTVDSTGLEIAENTGQFGGFVTAEWSPTEMLTISTTAQCTVNNIDNL